MYWDINYRFEQTLHTQIRLLFTSFLIRNKSVVIQFASLGHVIAL